VVVHCWGGLGRSGTIAAACLVARGAGAEEAIAAVRAARPGAVQTAAQELFVADFVERPGRFGR
jgi:protein-tyrosine phosphatase